MRGVSSFGTSKGQPARLVQMPPHLSQALGFCTKESLEPTTLCLLTYPAVLPVHDDKAKLFKVISRGEIGSACVPNHFVVENVVE